MAEERQAAVLELRTLTIGVRIGIHRWRQRDGLQSQKKAEKSEKGRLCIRHSLPSIALEGDEAS